MYGQMSAAFSLCSLDPVPLSFPWHCRPWMCSWTPTWPRLGPILTCLMAPVSRLTMPLRSPLQLLRLVMESDVGFEPSFFPIHLTINSSTLHPWQTSTREAFVTQILKMGTAAPGVPAVHDESRASLEALMHCMPHEVLSACLQYFQVGLPGTLVRNSSFLAA